MQYIVQNFYIYLKLPLIMIRNHSGNALFFHSFVICILKASQCFSSTVFFTWGDCEVSCYTL